MNVFTMMFAVKNFEILICLKQFQSEGENILYLGVLFDAETFLFYNTRSNCCSGPSYGRFVFFANCHFGGFEHFRFSFCLHFARFSVVLLLFHFDLLFLGLGLHGCCLLLAFDFCFTILLCLRVQISWSPCQIYTPHRKVESNQIIRGQSDRDLL